MNNWMDELFKAIEDYTICTDSDVEDFATKHHLNAGKVFKLIAMHQTEGTPCEGCKYIMMLPKMSPCINCSRLHKIDYYEKEENKND